MTAYSGSPAFHPSAPGGCCSACYNAHLRRGYPFVVICPHREVLVEVRGKRHYASWPAPIGELVNFVKLTAAA